MPPLCIVEDRRHPSPGMLALRLAEFEGITVRAVDVVPTELNNAEVVSFRQACGDQVRTRSRDQLGRTRAGDHPF